MSKKNSAVGFRKIVTDSILEGKGRKKIMADSGLSVLRRARSPLTAQLIETLNRPDSYVRIPLKESRTRYTTIFNLKDKAKRAGVEVQWAMSDDQKELYAWFVKKAKPQNGVEEATV